MESHGNGQSFMDVVLRFFQEDQWNFQQIGDKPVIRSGFRGEHGTWVCFAQVNEEHQRFLFHSIMGLNIPVQYRAAVAEYLTRVNYGLPLGNFEMDFETGDVRFKTSIEIPEGELTIAMVRTLAYANVRNMDHYFPGVLAVVHSGLSPEAALARAEVQMVEQ
jgi:hypothetical protein